MNDPIHKTVDVPLTPDDAFALFTDGINSWWPGATYSVSANKGSRPRDIRVETHKGGRIIETTKNGAECIWGEIIAYDPGRFLSFTWHPGHPATKATVVTVSFKATRTGTQCDLTHGGFDILGPIADAVSTSYLTAWHTVLGCFCSAKNAYIDA
ncbi:SRPBCC domain-containing protein [Yoonia maritima]|uniref:SRPBCC domain-containing protein n=1 Tax=Yoonia maritima TaxID=1435347 RepID=UPI000D0F3E28|nr:SRPBCC domain-containing protein [Yoonia maritima]